MAHLAHVANVGQMFVFGEVLDPNPETVNLVEDIVRSQIIELVSRLSIGCNFTPQILNMLPDSASSYPCE
jgi:hypothetical protein